MNLLLTKTIKVKTIYLVSYSLLSYWLQIKMSAEEMDLVAKSLALHPPIMVATLCLFMYIRGKALSGSSPTKKVNPIFPFRHV